MIKFFRHIRKDLMETGKTGKYIKYAIGEIVLVMVGILLALQVNNWNNDKKDLKKEKYYLNSIKTSIQLSQNEFSRVIGDAELISSSAETLFLLLAHEKFEQLNDFFLDSLLLSAGDYSKISLNDGGIQEILNTGSLDIIQDERIRVILASWDERLHKIRKFEDDTEYFSRNYNEIVLDYFDFSRFELDSLNSVVIPEKKQKLLTDPMLRNYLDRIHWAHKMMKTMYLEEKKALDSLTKLIDQNLLE